MKLARANRLESVMRQVCETALFVGYEAAAFFFVMAGFLGAGMMKPLSQNAAIGIEKNWVAGAVISAGPSLFFIGAMVCAARLAWAGYRLVVRENDDAALATAPEYTAIVTFFLFTIGVCLAGGKDGTWFTSVEWRLVAGIGLLVVSMLLFFGVVCTSKRQAGARQQSDS